MAISVITISCEHSDATVGDDEQSGEGQDPGITPSKKRGEIQQSDYSGGLWLHGDR